MLTPFKGNLYGTQCAMHQSTSEYLLACGLRAGMEFGVGWCGSPLRQTSHSTSGKKKPHFSSLLCWRQCISRSSWRLNVMYVKDAEWASKCAMNTGCAWNCFSQVSMCVLISLVSAWRTFTCMDGEAHSCQKPVTELHAWSWGYSQLWANGCVCAERATQVVCVSSCVRETQSPTPWTFTWPQEPISISTDLGPTFPFISTFFHLPWTTVQ